MLSKLVKRGFIDAECFPVVGPRRSGQLPQQLTCMTSGFLDDLGWGSQSAREDSKGFSFISVWAAKSRFMLRRVGQSRTYPWVGSENSIMILTPLPSFLISPPHKMNGEVSRSFKANHE